MKIGVFFPGFPPQAGGGHAFEREMLQSLVSLAGESRHEWVIFFGKTDGFVIPPEIARAGIKTRVAEDGKPGLPQRIFNRLRKELGMQSPARGISALQAAAGQEKIEFIWFATSISSPVELPYIATVWDIQHRLQPWFPEVSREGQWNYREAYYSAYLQRAAYIISPNCAGRNELSLFYQIPAERFRLLPHPTPRIETLPTPQVITQTLKKYELQQGYLFYPAQFWAHKNHANLLLALKVLKEQHGLVKDLLLVGSNQGNFEYVRGMVKSLGLESQVHFPGFVPREDLIAFYCGAFALFFVSLFGPENLPPLEAFQCGCPVIVSDYNGALEQLGDAALRVNALNPAEIASAILRLERGPSLRQTLIEKGRPRGASYTGLDYVRGVFKICDEFEAVRRTWGAD